MKRLSILLAVIVSLPLGLRAQNIPVDPAVRIGHLDNGLTYYIRHNEEPAGQANFYIAQKVGSILEEENQRGLAHFLEHMCFNGTEHFPGNNIIKYCESIGVKFGADLNAYTSIDETVYNIDNVPVANVPSAVDSCLWILHDWADGLLLEGDDIDHERGVIHEEWRSRMNAQMRMYGTILPALYPDGNRYAERMPIGTMEVVDNFPYQALRDYYAKWYRPDQQGIVVVGDIDVDAVEAKIKDIFGTIAKPENPAERFYVQVPDNKEPIFVIASDKEQPYAITYIFRKHDAFTAEDKAGLGYWVADYARTLAESMIEQRLDELTLLPEPPFIQAEIEDGDYMLSKTKGAFTGVAVSNPDGLVKAATTVYREMLRAARNGFTASEYERARTEYLTQVETAYKQKDKRKSATFCKAYVRNFIDGDPIPGIENTYALANRLAPNIPVEVVNQVVAQLVPEGNLAVACMLPQVDGVTYPTEAELAAAFAAVEAENIAPYEDNASDEPLMSELPAAGRIKSTKDFKFGYKKLTLSNGATVYIRQTDFNADQIVMRAYSDGGLSLYDLGESVNLRAVSDLLGVGGVGNFSATALTKALTGKQLSVSPSVSALSESVSASTTPKDLETMMQLNYLYFTAMRSDDDAFASTVNRMRALLENAEAQPMTAFQDSLTRSLYKTAALAGSLKAKDLDSIDYDRVMQIARERFANAADFTFIITGNYDEAVLLPLIEQYIASLPAGGKKEKANTKAVALRNGKVENVFDKKMEVPTSTCVFVNSGKTGLDLRSQLLMTVATQALSIDLLSEIREKEGGTYSINAAGQMIDALKTGLVQVVYQTSPDRVAELDEKVLALVDKFIADGPSEENVAKVKEYLVKNYQENQRENSYWGSVLLKYLTTGVDANTTYESVLDSITPADCSKFLTSIWKQGNSLHVEMNGVE